ncbi:Uncharacterised protein [uncultured archaeon]|nr:Uncharacterised protein [uncultured archaeon]
MKKSTTYGRTSIAPADSRFPSITATASAAPIVRLPMSPVKTFAGNQLNFRKTRSAPSMAAEIIAISVEPFCTARKSVAAKMTEPMPASIPLKPASMLVRLDATAMPSGMRSTM